MNEHVGKICPYCRTPITETDAVIVCPACGIPHHANCWVENKGCTTFGCSEQNYQAQNTNPTDVCLKCGAPVGEGQAFCPRCGEPRQAPAAANVCSKCGTQLTAGQEFCPTCGQRAGQMLDPNVNNAINQFNSGLEQKKKKKGKLGLILGIGAGVVALGGALLIGLVILIAIIASLGGDDFSDMFPELENKVWCTISSDGQTMRIDTNPFNWDDDGLAYPDAYYEIEEINRELGLPSALYETMGETRGLDGLQTRTYDDVTVSWSYHPDRGLEVTYELR